MSKAMFTVPIENRYFEDYVAGSVHEFGPIAVEEAEVIAFARRFDPQPFHVEPEAAQQTVFGGLIASGWHTASLMMRLIVDHYLSKVASLGSPGIDELRWLKPVRPGDALSVRVTILETKRSRSKPDRGIVRSFVEVLNQVDEVVMSMTAANFMLCREVPQEGIGLDA
ncbi:MAG: MaoC family dehydratase [Anaerolineae bacterium]|nr:MaoC family dehydratase [Anaerolineae bacterium]